MNSCLTIGTHEKVTVVDYKINKKNNLNQAGDAGDVRLLIMVGPVSEDICIMSAVLRVSQLRHRKETESSAKLKESVVIYQAGQVSGYLSFCCFSFLFYYLVSPLTLKKCNTKSLEYC